MVYSINITVLLDVFLLGLKISLPGENILLVSLRDEYTVHRTTCTNQEAATFCELRNPHFIDSIRPNVLQDPVHFTCSLFERMESMKSAKPVPVVLLTQHANCHSTRLQKIK